MLNSVITRLSLVRKINYIWLNNLYKFPYKNSSIQNSELVVNLKIKEDFEKEVLKSKLPVLIDFYADWCEPCKKASLVLESKANDLKTFKLVKINIDNHPDILEQFHVEGIPYLLLIKDGKKIGELVGFSESKLNNMLNEM